jgi:hypothetical protein
VEHLRILNQTRLSETLLPRNFTALAPSSESQVGSQRFRLEEETPKRRTSPVTDNPGFSCNYLFYVASEWRTGSEIVTSHVGLREACFQGKDGVIVDDPHQGKSTSCPDSVQHVINGAKNVVGDSIGDGRAEIKSAENSELNTNSNISPHPFQSLLPHPA